MMQEAIRRNHWDLWRAHMAAEPPERFAFEDWRFVRDGLPQAP